MYHAGVNGLPFPVASALVLLAAVAVPSGAAGEGPPGSRPPAPAALLAVSAVAAGGSAAPGGSWESSRGSAGLEVERVLAVVNSVPILLSDLELALVAQMIPRIPDEDDASFEEAVTEALVALELRWRNLEAAGIPGRIRVDLDAAWQRVVERTGGESVLRSELATRSLREADLRQLVRRAAVVEAYVASRFAPFARPTPEEVESVWREELKPQLLAQGQEADSPEPYRRRLEQLVRERKLEAEIRRWTEDLELRGEVIRYRK